MSAPRPGRPASTSSSGGKGPPSCSSTARWPPAEEEWDAQRPLVEEGFAFVAPDRRGLRPQPSGVRRGLPAGCRGRRRAARRRRPPGRPLLRRARRAVCRRPTTRSDTVPDAPRARHAWRSARAIRPAGRSCATSAQAWDRDHDDETWVVRVPAGPSAATPTSSLPTSSPPPSRWCHCSGPRAPCGRPPCPSPSWRPPRSRSSSSPAATAPGSTRSATTWLPRSER